MSNLQIKMEYYQWEWKKQLKKRNLHGIII